jgi:hypothetical protein
MKLSLLEIVQDILNDIDGDEVNSIDDTFESQQIAQIVKSTYLAMISNRNWPHTKRLISLQASGDDAYPTHVTVQSSIKEMISLNYNKVRDGETRKRYESVRWADPDDFLRHTNRRNSDADNIDVIVDYSGVELLIRNDLHPTYYTSFDDSVIVFDSYDKSVDDTIQESKIQARAYVIPEWVHEDDAIPDLPEEAFPALVEEAKSKASLKLRQIQDAKAEQEAGRQQRWLSRKAWRVQGGIQYPDYGRKGGKCPSPYFDKNNKKPTP